MLFRSQIYSVPGRLNETWFQVEKEGIYYGQCNQICGVNHAFMPIAVEAVDAPTFERWAAEAKKRFADSGLPPWWPVGLRANATATANARGRSTANAPGRAEDGASARDAISQAQAAMSHGLMPDPLPPEPPERALQRLGPLELPGAPADLETRLAALYQQLVGAAAATGIAPHGRKPCRIPGFRFHAVP